jgi:ferrous iron transport protein B
MTDQSATCHSGPQADVRGLPLLAIVGCPNVGKSVLFNKLTGAYVTVSNYPGTTVEVSRGKGRVDGRAVGVVDTPGMYRLLPITEEERVARAILLREQPEIVIHVADAKNLERMLPMTLQLIEAGLPVVLDLNLMDEAERIGMQVDAGALERALGVPVVTTALARGRGADELKERLAGVLHGRQVPAREDAAACGCGAVALCGDAGAAPVPAVRYQPALESALAQIEARLQGAYRLSRRAIALLLLENDPEVEALVREQEGARAAAILADAKLAQARFNQPVAFMAARQQLAAAQRILQSAVTLPQQRPAGFAERLSDAMINPLTGLPILLLVLAVLYELVGVFGAQTMVGFLENAVFGTYVNPLVDQALAALIPWPALRELFGGQYGVITLGVRYAVALILPIVGMFFIVFSVIEDSGYLPRLAMLIDRIFKTIGLNGRAVIPLVLGFGCDTMATVVTRTLETPRERLLATLLLSLAIPCSAQLGVMLGMLGGQPALLAVWLLIVTAVFLLVGYLAAQLMPGERPSFYMELPPLRLPTLENVLVKTYTRMEWYFREVFPVFIGASVVIWLGRMTGAFDLTVTALAPLVRLMGLPDQTAVTFLFGFFRRDYGAAGLYDLRNQLTGVQLLVATTTLTLFVPCIAQFSVTMKERGWKTAVAMTAFIFPFAFAVGALLNWALHALGVTL